MAVFELCAYISVIYKVYSFVVTFKGRCVLYIGMYKCDLLTAKLRKISGGGNREVSEAVPGEANVMLVSCSVCDKCGKLAIIMRFVKSAVLGYILGVLAFRNSRTGCTSVQICASLP